MNFKNLFITLLIFSFTLVNVNLFSSEKGNFFSIFESFLFSNLQEDEKNISKENKLGSGFKNLVYKHKNVLKEKFDSEKSILSELNEVSKMFAKVFYTNSNLLYTNQMDQFFNQIGFGYLNKMSLNPEENVGDLKNFNNYTSIYQTSYYHDDKFYTIKYSLVKNGNNVNIKKMTNNNGDIYQTNFEYILDKSLQADEFFNKKKFYSKKYMMI